MSWLLIALVVVVLVALVAHLVLSARFVRRVAESMTLLRALPEVAPEGRARLPAVVQNWIEVAGVDRGSAPVTVRLRQSAELRMAPDKDWAPLRCEQVIALRCPGFVWLADQQRGPLRVVRVVDAFVEGRGWLEARLLGSIRVARMSGPDADRSELMRYLAELPWAPDAALHNPAIRWRQIAPMIVDDAAPNTAGNPGENAAEDVVELEADSNGGVARVRLHFDRHGDVVEMQADERGSSEKGMVVQRPWRGYFSEHREMGGRRIPTRGEVGYVYEDGYAPYWRGVITDYEVEQVRGEP